MADAPAGAQSGIVTHHFGHETVGVQAALHQRGRPPVADEPHRRGCRRLAVRRIDDLIVADRQPARRGGRFDPRGRSVRSALRAASSAPSSELRSHGCATAVGIGASVRQCSMRRRYFSCLFSIVVPGCPSLHTLEGRYRLLGRPLRGRRASTARMRCRAAHCCSLTDALCTRGSASSLSSNVSSRWRSSGRTSSAGSVATACCGA